MSKLSQVCWTRCDPLCVGLVEERQVKFQIDQYRLTPPLFKTNFDPLCSSY